MKNLMRKLFPMKLRRIARTMVGRDFFAKLDRDCPKERIGSEYGGWDTMIDRISPNSVIYSVGVGQDISFDLEIMNRFGVTVHAFDPTPKSIDWVRQQNLSQPFSMHEYGLADFEVQLHSIHLRTHSTSHTRYYLDPLPKRVQSQCLSNV